MGYKFTIDQGNSAAKVVVWDNDEVIDLSCHRHLSVEFVERLAQRYTPSAAIYCTVTCGGDDIVDALQRLCPRVYRMSVDMPLPVTIAYRTPQTLGLDRIADVVGAQVVAPGNWVLVVDIGTAITYDVLSPEGVFVGGNIAPGVFVRLEALNHFTARLPLVETDGPCPEWGVDTDTALRAGAIRGVVAELEYYRGLLPPEAKVILTGGAVDLLTPYVKFPVIIDHHLVQKGLNSILRYNENI
ncbi:MAG: type III pantothenate kinase [Muribaculaceae bacterium]|nr:type III pantothenate kinase [Muribaculaceae bacterium]